SEAFFIRMFTTFLAEWNPASTSAKPACMKNTNTPATNTQRVSTATVSWAVASASCANPAAAVVASRVATIAAIVRPPGRKAARVAVATGTGTDGAARWAAECGGRLISTSLGDASAGSTVAARPIPPHGRVGCGGAYTDGISLSRKKLQRGREERYAMHEFVG